MAALALLISMLVLPSPAGAVTTTTSMASTSARAYSVPSSFDQGVLYYTNLARRQHHRKPLRLMSCLDNFATTWSAQMASRDVMGHQSLTTVLRTCGRRSVGENVGWGTNDLTPRQLVGMWMRSPAHRHNILKRSFRLIGIGAYRSTSSGRIYATQEFGR
ncbi:MAG: CAP domain-containing protein [Marmoricola sp.]